MGCEGELAHDKDSYRQVLDRQPPTVTVFLMGKVLRLVRHGLGQREPPGAAP